MHGTDPTADLPGVHPALAKHTGFLLSRAGIMAQKQFAGQLESLDVSLRAWGALNVLDHEGEITQHALGLCTRADPSTVVAIIDELEAKGLVERRRHPSDRRAHALHVTDAGRKTLVKGRKLARAAQEGLLAPLSEQERVQLHALLLKLAVPSV
jgi:DNA-binding MarR family transcriptional regulator